MAKSAFEFTIGQKPAEVATLKLRCIPEPGSELSDSPRQQVLEATLSNPTGPITKAFVSELNRYGGPPGLADLWRRVRGAQYPVVKGRNWIVEFTTEFALEVAGRQGKGQLARQ